MDILSPLAGCGVSGELAFALLLVEQQDSDLLDRMADMGDSGLHSGGASSVRVRVLGILIAMALAFQVGREVTIHSVMKTAYIQGYVDCWRGIDSAVQENSNPEVRLLQNEFSQKRVSVEMAKKHGAFQSLLYQQARKESAE